MIPLLSLNLIRVLFVAFTAVVGTTIGDGQGHPWTGGAAGAAFSLCIVLADRLLKGVSLRLFSSASFGLLMGLIFARLLLASKFLRDVGPAAEWVASLGIYSACAYLGTMLPVR